MLSIQRFILALVASLFAVSAAAETYIIPIYARALAASDGTWWAQFMATNTSAVPVTYIVTGVFPLQTSPCSECTGVPAVRTIEPGGRVFVGPGDLPGYRMTAGAFSIESSGPLIFDAVAYRAGINELRQRLDVARGWIPAGTHTIGAIERGDTNWRMNVFVVNPSSEAVSVSVWAGRRSENEIRVEVAPRTTQLIRVPPPLCNGAPCPYPTVYPPTPISIDIESTGPILASASSVTPQWAVFALANEAQEP